MEQRRRELHGTSSESDNMPYQPGDYLRTQREARREAREADSNSATSRLLRYALLIVVVGLAMIYLFPRITSLLERIMQDPNAVESVEDSAAGGIFSSDAEAPTEGSATMILNEQHGDIDFTKFESLTPEIINEIEEYNNNHTLTIYSDDVEIVDGKRVE